MAPDDEPAACGLVSNIRKEKAGRFVDSPAFLILFTFSAL
jgi:hypothetical protein